MQTWMPGAVARPVSLTGSNRRSNGPMEVCYGAVLHVNDAYSDDLYTWIVQGGSMSCHFQVNMQGKIYQYIPIDWTSWCQSAGNENWISIETSGKPSEALNAAQLDAVCRIWKFCREQRNLANQLADSPLGRGFGWHGMGASPHWNGPQWGHSACPGEPRKAQRQIALNYAAGIGGTEEDDMFSDADRANLAWLRARIEGRDVQRFSVVDPKTGRLVDAEAGAPGAFALRSADVGDVWSLIYLLQGVQGTLAGPTLSEQVAQAVVAALPQSEGGAGAALTDADIERITDALNDRLRSVPITFGGAE